jgi:PPE-repeat protein
MNFAVLPPEVTSAQMYSGAGSAPLLAAAASWAGLGDELGSAADSFSAVISGLAGAAWQGPASAAMAAVATQYAQWLNASAAQAAGAAAQANATAAIFEAAKAAIAHPAAVSANRMQLLSLVRSNLFGFNAPAIAAAEGAYEVMWAQNVAALSGYHGAASAAVAQLVPWQRLPQAASTPATALAVLRAIAATDQADVARVVRYDRNEIAYARAQVGGDLSAAGADLAAGRIGPAARRAFDAGRVVRREVERVVTQTAALPAQLATDDVDILTGRPAATLPPSPTE